MERRKPTFGESIAALMVMVVFIFVGFMMFQLRVELLMIASAAGAGFLAWRLGYTWEDMENAICQRIMRATPAILIIWVIGIVISTLMFSGSIPMLIYYGIKMVDPQYVIIASFFICMVFSTVTGTSWGSAGTAGVAFMGVAAGLGVPLPMTAAAVICGATFGDKLSPLSETTNLAPACVGINLYDHIKAMMWTTLPATAAAFIVFFIAGNSLTITAAGLPPEALELTDTLDQMFRWSPILLIPFLFILGGAILKKPPVPTMLLGSLSAIIIGMAFQGFSVQDGVLAALNGFNISMVNTSGFAAESAPASIAALMNRGGIKSMVGVVVIIYCGYAYAAIISKAGFLETAVKPMADRVKSRGAVMCATLFTELLLLVFSGNSYTGAIMVPEMFKRSFLESGMGLKALSRTIEDIGTIVAPLVPWGSSGAFYVGALGVSIFGAGGYAPWCITCYITPIIAIILAVTGIGVYRMNEEEKTAALEKYELELAAL